MLFREVVYRGVLWGSAAYCASKKSPRRTSVHLLAIWNLFTERGAFILNLLNRSSVHYKATKNHFFEFKRDIVSTSPALTKLLWEDERREAKAGGPSTRSYPHARSLAHEHINLLFHSKAVSRSTHGCHHSHAQNLRMYSKQWATSSPSLKIVIVR